MIDPRNVGFTDVLAEEQVFIAQRRVNVGLNEQASGPSDGETVQDASRRNELSKGAQVGATVGLALSGGGLRSACISLGLAQSLYRRGILRHVDYLSTVSGGGYLGAHLTSFLACCGRKVNWAPNANRSNVDNVSSRNTTTDTLPFHNVPGSPQPDAVIRLSHSGKNMLRPLTFLSRHLWGLLLVNGFVLSGLIAIGALAAYLFRMLDYPIVATFVSQLGFSDDILRAFLPSIVLFFVWLVSIAVTAFMRSKGILLPPVANWSYVALMVTIVMGFVVVLSTGNASMKYLEDVWYVPQGVTSALQSGIAWLSRWILVLMAAIIAPYLNMQAIIRSGVNASPKRWIERWCFNLFGGAILIGAPFVVFFVLSRENISDHLVNRSPKHEMAPGHIRNWPELTRTIRDPMDLRQYGDRASTRNLIDNQDASPSDVVWWWLDEAQLKTLEDRSDGAERMKVENAVTQKNWRLERHPLVEVMVQEELNLETKRRLRFWHRWVQFAQYLVGAGTDFQSHWNDDARLREWKFAIIKEWNEQILRDPSLCLCFNTERVLKAQQFQIAKPNEMQSGSTKPEPLLEATTTTHLPTIVEPSFSPKGSKTSVGFKPNDPLDAATITGIPDRLAVIESLVPNALKVRQELLALKKKEDSLKEKEDSLERNLKEVNEFGNESKDKVLIKNDLEKSQSDAAMSEELWEWFAKKYRDAKDDLDYKRSAIGLVSEEFRDDYQKSVSRATTEFQKFEEYMTRVTALNWNLLRTYFGSELIYPQGEVFGSVVIAHDQEYRLRVAAMSGIIFVLLGLLVPVNSTIMHSVYRDQLSAQWLFRHPDFGFSIPLAKTIDSSTGGPFPLINCTANLGGMQNDQQAGNVSTFTLSPLHVGSTRTGFCRTCNYMKGRLDLADAMTLSGAAVSPLSAGNILLKSLLTLFNLRLGQWIPNPIRPPKDLSWPSALGLLHSHFFTEPTLRRYVFVSDGGHFDNTGIQSLLERRCRVIIALDASDDEAAGFADFRKLVARMATNCGIRFSHIGSEAKTITADDLTLEKTTSLANRHMVMQISYPQDSDEEGDARCSYLIYIKPRLVGNEPFELSGLKIDQGNFPHDPTTDQFFSSDRFLAYCRFGELIGDEVCDAIQESSNGELNQSGPWLAERWMLPKNPTLNLKNAPKDDFGNEAKENQLTALQDHVDENEAHTSRPKSPK